MGRSCGPKGSRKEKICTPVKRGAEKRGKNASKGTQETFNGKKKGSGGLKKKGGHHDTTKWQKKKKVTPRGEMGVEVRASPKGCRARSEREKGDGTRGGGHSPG